MGAGESGTDSVRRGNRLSGFFVAVSDACPGESGIARGTVQVDDECEGADEECDVHEGFAGCSSHG